MVLFHVSEKDICTHSDTSTIKANGEKMCEYDSKHVGIEDKFISSILNDSAKKTDIPINNNSALFRKWQTQSDFQFGFIPIDEQVMPASSVIKCSDGLSPFSAHALVKPLKNQITWKPDFLFPLN